MQMNRLAQIAIVVIIASGCSHTVATKSAEAVSFYTSFENPVPGLWAVVVDESTTEFSTVINLSADFCVGHSYPFDPGTAISSSIHGTLANVFEETSRNQASPTAQTMREQEITGAVFVRLDRFDAGLACDVGGFTFPCIGEANMRFGVQVNGRGGTLLDFSVGAIRTATGRAPMTSCAKIGDFFADAYGEALNESLQKMAERLSDSEQLRAARDATKAPKTTELPKSQW